ncbi:hypothetical protein NKH57_20090 [Mesorhizobium sp. M1050]|uniref:hypothetical protein n=1 Tax=Mesorhizobium sp. M1050 TaxID=2957051 RepID=UPI00333B842E
MDLIGAAMLVGMAVVFLLSTQILKRGQDDGQRRSAITDRPRNRIGNPLGSWLSAATISFALGVLALRASASAIYSRPMGGLFVASFIALGTISAAVSIGSVFGLIWKFTRSQMRTSLDGFF